MEVRPVEDCLNVVRVQKLSHGTSGVLRMCNGVAARYAADASLPENVLGVPRPWLPFLPASVSVEHVAGALRAVERVEFRAMSSLPCYPIDERDVGALLAGLVVSVGSLATIALHGRIFVVQAMSFSSPGDPLSFGVVGRETRISIAPSPSPKDRADGSSSECANSARDALEQIARLKANGVQHLSDSTVCVVGAPPSSERSIVQRLKDSFRIVRPPVGLLLPDSESADSSTANEDALKVWAEHHGTTGCVAYVQCARVLSLDGCARVVKRLVDIIPQSMVLVFRDTPLDIPTVRHVPFVGKPLESLGERLRHAVNTGVRGMSDEDSLRQVALFSRVAVAHGSCGRLIPPSLTSWDSIAGYSALKVRVRSLVYRYGLHMASHAQECGVARAMPPVRGILLHGPSGCGKSMVVAALATDSIVPVVAIDAPSVLGRYLGESEAALRAAFAAARAGGPAILVLENVEFLGARRVPGTDDSADAGGVGRRLLSTLLNELDGIGQRVSESPLARKRSHVLVVATTTDKALLDDALLRPGRLDHHVCVDFPSASDRLAIIANASRRLGVPHCEDDVASLAARSDGLSGADVVGLVASAAFHSQSLSDVSNALAATR